MDFTLLAVIVICAVVGYLVGLWYPNPKIKEWSEKLFKKKPPKSRKSKPKKDHKEKWG